MDDPQIPKPINCCNTTHEDCPRYGDNESEPCWGWMFLADYDWEMGPLHACEGHRDQVAGDGPYKPESR